MKKYSALIIGAGNIAGGFDNSCSKEILTHAHAYKNNESINFLGFYDIDFSKAQKAAEKWSAKAFDKLPYADIISICTPDEFHVKTVLEAEKLKPKLIFLEKPVCTNKQDINILKNIKTPILVNYSRSFSKSFRNLSERNKNNEFGNYKSGFGYYGKGFIHNGSHMINLLNLLIGDIVNIEFKDEIIDFYENDSSKTSVLSFQNGAKFIMTPVDCRNYTIFELDLIFEKARIKILNSGYNIEIYKIKESEKFKGYKFLELSEKINTDLDFVMRNAIQNIIDYLTHGSKLYCSLDEGIKAIQYEKNFILCK